MTPDPAHDDVVDVLVADHHALLHPVLRDPLTVSEPVELGREAGAVSHPSDPAGTTTVLG